MVTLPALITRTQGYSLAFDGQGKFNAPCRELIEVVAQDPGTGKGNHCLRAENLLGQKSMQDVPGENYTACMISESTREAIASFIQRVAENIRLVKNAHRLVVAAKRRYRIDPEDPTEAVEVMSEAVKHVVYDCINSVRNWNKTEIYRINKSMSDDLILTCIEQIYRIYEKWRSERKRDETPFFYYCKKSLRFEINHLLDRESWILIAPIEDFEGMPDSVDVADLAWQNLRKERFKKTIQLLPDDEQRYVNDCLRYEEPPRLMATRWGVDVRDIYDLQKCSFRRLRRLLQSSVFKRPQNRNHTASASHPLRAGGFNPPTFLATTFFAAIWTRFLLNGRRSIAGKWPFGSHTWRSAIHKKTEERASYSPMTSWRRGGFPMSPR
jgi:hypothetical protein